MARIRTIKPDSAVSLSVQGVSIEARYFFQNLWCHLDDEGRCEWLPKQLLANIFPSEDDPYTVADVRAWVEELQSKDNMLRLYEAAGKKYLQAPSWDRHQNINRPTPSKHPSYEDALKTQSVEGEDALKAHGALTEDSLRARQEMEREMEREEEQGASHACAHEEPPPAPAAEIVAHEPAWFDLEETMASAIGRGIESTTLQGGKYPYAGLADEDKCRKLAERWSSLGGDTDGLDSLLTAWQDKHSDLRKAPYKTPVRALGEWVTQREPKMLQVKRERERDAGKNGKSSKPTALEIAEAAARGMGATF